MKKEPVIAIAGATGVVGSEMLTVLEELEFPCSALRLLASQDSVGEVYSFRQEEVEVELLHEAAFEGVDIALFATSAELSAKFVPLAVSSGAVAIDNSSHFRMQVDVPLVVPEVNPDAISASSKIIANPNCSTIQLVPILKVIHENAGLKRVVVSTYQSVSGAGKAALDELWNQTLAIFNQQSFESEVFPHQIAFNCIPHIDVILDNGYSKEEYKIINESRKILEIPGLPITATAVRVPVFHAHAESVNVETVRELPLRRFMDLLEQAKGVQVYPSFVEYPVQLDVAQNNLIHVGRIRKDESVAHGFDMWIVADNLRKGAALNAVQIAQLLIEKFAQH